MKGTKNPTILVLASSKRTDQSYMETFIEGKKKNESKTTLVIDEPQWVIRTDKDSKEKFKVAIGNKFLNSEVVPLDATESDIQNYRDRGFILLDVPIGYYESFIDDIDIALTDIAGISTSNTTRYIAGNRIANVKNQKIQNLFTKDIIEVGNSRDDNTQYYDFIDLNRLDKSMLGKPLYIHMDMSTSGDKTGIAGVWIKGKRPHIDGQPDNKDLFFRLAFSVSVKAPKGYQISFEKNRQFIRWLRAQGFAIKGISTDTYQSADTLQQLAAENFKTDIISVDRVQDQICIPYQMLKSTIYEERVEMYEAPLLTEELVGLERNNNGKIDHTSNGINSKDQADAFCLHPDTEIFLLSGKHKTIKQLYENYDNEWVLAYNTESNKLEPVKIQSVVNNGYKDNLIKLTLDNGKSLICTEDHKILTRNGEYKEAKDCLNESLMPFSYENKPSYNDILKLGFCIYNHRVINIEKVSGSTVYDLKLDKIHNFALTSGIFVHNCGALFNASKHAEEYAFEYGDDIETTLSVSQDNSESSQKKQITVDFEKELNQILDPFNEYAKKQIKKDNETYINFGMGAAKPLVNDPFYMMNGIIL